MSKWYPKLVVKNWWNMSTGDKQVWMAKVRTKLTANIDLIRKLEAEEKEEQRARLQKFLNEEGTTNTGRFRRWRLRLVNDPDGEAIKDKDGAILVDETRIRDRYGEYYANLFGGEETRVDAPNECDRKEWMDPRVMKENKEKLNLATNNTSIIYEVPSIEEYYQVIMSSDPTSSGGHDLIQYGILTKLSIGTHLAIVGLIGTWWRTKSLPSILRIVEVCSLHKRGDRMDLINKRGIGLISKLVLIMETVLLNRISKALDKANTRSRAQGGARKGVHTTDVIVALVNVIHHAKRHNKPLHLLEFDLFKFFDRIPHRAFVDAHLYFGFDEDTIKMASLFWEDFVGQARSRFGLSGPFPIKIGNIQGLAGSPSRSGLVLDMLLCLLERQNFGYRYTTSNFFTDREFDIDHVVANIPAVAWVDDITLVEENYDRLKEAMSKYVAFINYYGMRLVPDKCKHYHINDEKADGKQLDFKDFNGKQHYIKEVGTTEAFRCLGVFLNMNAEWTAHADHIIGKLDNFTVKIGKHWSPAWLTAKVVNSNAIPSVTYGLSIVELQEQEIAKIQAAIIKPVVKDGNHSIFTPRKAYVMPIEKRGYNVASISAIYKATKIGGVYHFLNSKYVLSRITTRMVFWDFARLQGNFASPLDGVSKITKEARKAGLPDYLVAAADVLIENRSAIIPREGWDLDNMTIVTFAKCVAGWNSKSNVVDILRRKGMRYMRQICTWFAPTITWESLDGAKISIITLLAAMRGLGKIYHIPQTDPLELEVECDQLNGSRKTVLREMIRQGMMNIATSQHALTFVPARYKEHKNWSALRLENLGVRTLDTGRWYSDGARIIGRASFAVVSKKHDLIIKSNINGRTTSQRAELKGLEAAAFLGPNKDKVLDPYFIVATVNKACRGDIAEHEWAKIDNRSLIRSVAHLQKNHPCNISWVKGHQKGDVTEDGKHNIHADEQAKTLTLTPGIPLVGEAWEHVDDYFFLNKGELYEGDVRRVIFEQIMEEEYDALCTKSERFGHKGWWMEQPRNTESVKYGTLRFKLFTKTLPTHSRLSRSFPGLYEELTCPGCGEGKETEEHIFVTCDAYQDHKSKVWRNIIAIISEHTDLRSNEVRKEVDDWVTGSKDLEEESRLWFLGGVPEKVKVWASKFLRAKALTVMWQTIHKVVMETVYDIWRKRCDANSKKGWTFQELHMEFIEDALILENNLFGVDVNQMWDINN